MTVANQQQMVLSRLKRFDNVSCSIEPKGKTDS